MFLKGMQRTAYHSHERQKKCNFVPKFNLSLMYSIKSFKDSRESFQSPFLESEISIEVIWELENGILFFQQMPNF